VVVYVFLLVLLRLTGKRQVGQLAPFDLVLLLVISNTVQNAMNAGDNSITAGMLLALMGGWIFLIRYMNWDGGRVASGFWTASWMGGFWLMLGVGFGTEVTVIALVGGLTARAAGPALLGGRLPARRLLDPAGARVLPVAVVAVVAGAVTAVAALAGFVPWLFVYGLLGLCAPAVVIDRLGPGRALLRSMVLAGRAGMRAAWIRLGGYLGWAAVRVALVLGGLALISVFLGGVGPGWARLLQLAAVAAVNAVAYATLAKRARADLREGLLDTGIPDVG